MDSAIAPLVHTIPTTDPPTPTDDFQAWSTRSTLSEWSLSVELYRSIADLGDEDHLDRILSCRKKAWFVQNSETLDIRVASKKCNLRWCPLCAESRQYFIADQTEAWLKTAHHPKLLTLTLRHTSAPLTNQIDFLYECFRQLRKKAYFKKNVIGGIWFFQVKLSKDDCTWHPHLHCVIDGNYLKFHQIQNLWINITKGSKFVNIKTCSNIQNSAKHIARYAARPADLSDKTLSQQLELYYALRSKRLVSSWGSARPMSFRPCKPDDAHLWKDIGSWQTVQAMRGISDEADMIWKSFSTNQPPPCLVTMRPLEMLMAGVDYAAKPPPPIEQYLDFYKSD